MTKIEELHLIAELIQKHNLPLSPIMEYAIREREEQYIKEQFPDNIIVIASESQERFTICKKIEDYCEEFSKLSVGVSRGKKLPHKAILLIAIMQLIGLGAIKENKIPLEKTISDAFSMCWKKHLAGTQVPSVWTPFYHLKSESFWHFKAAETEEKLLMFLSFGGTPSIGKMRPVIKYVYLDDALFAFMKIPKNRDMLTQALEETFINQH